MSGSVSRNRNATGYDAGIGGTELAYQRCVGDGTSLGAFGNFGGSTIGLFGAGLQRNVGPFGSLFGGYGLQANGRQGYHTGSAGWQLIW